VYGGGEALTEAAPLEPLPGFAYAADKVACERWLMEELPRAVRLRPHIVLGPQALPLLKRLVHLRVGLRQLPPLPQLQLVHEQDVVAAVLRALAREVSGPFNLATDDAFTLDELAAYAGGARLRVSPVAARTLLGMLWLLGGAGGEPGWGGGLTRPLTLDTERARLLLGWRPAFPGWRQVLLSMEEGKVDAKR
jgi:nucleoside-diphosphate-sugar epimerase